MAQAVINGRAYDGAQMELNILGVDVTRFEEVRYETSQEHQLNYGKGQDAISWSKGRKSYSGSLTLYQEEITAIENALPPGSDLTDIPPFVIGVVYFNGAGQAISDAVTAKFQNSPRGANTADMGIKQTLELFVIGVKPNYKR